MSIVFALVGRPNVGKSTLFNRLTRTRDALVADIPGLTRDRQYGVGKLGLDEENGESYMVIDCGGLNDNPEGIENLMADQVWQAVEECDVVLFIVDGRLGLSSADETIANSLRKSRKPIYLLVNKTEGLDDDAVLDFYNMGLGQPYPISAAHNSNVQSMVEMVLKDHPELMDDVHVETDATKIAIIGRPNVGKSTLINRLIGEDRLLAFDMPGTTRDSIDVEFEEDGKQYVLIDTAGVRKRGKVKETIEKFSVIKTIQAIERSNAVILLVDAHEGFTDQDANLLSLALNSGKALVIGVNKWDGMTAYQREQVKVLLDRKLHFIDFAPIHFISSLHGSGIRDLFASVEEVYEISLTRIPTNVLTSSLEVAVRQHSPPLIKGHRVKLRYAHQGGHNPPVIVIHGNQTDSVPDSYKRYLMNHFREEFDLKGTPIKLEFRSSENPFKDRKNTLTRRQIGRKQRLKKYTNKKK